MSVKIPTSLATKLNLATAMLLDCDQLLTIKMLHLHILVFMKVVDFDLSFPMPQKSTNFDICNSNYDQISGQKSYSNKTTMLAS